MADKSAKTCFARHLARRLIEAWNAAHEVFAMYLRRQLKVRRRLERFKEVLQQSRLIPEFLEVEMAGGTPALAKCR